MVRTTKFLIYSICISIFICSLDETTQVLLADFDKTHPGVVPMEDNQLFYEFKETAEIVKHVYGNYIENAR